jgi:cbb3-type cytochrome oxidase subunit 1
MPRSRRCDEQRLASAEPFIALARAAIMTWFVRAFLKASVSWLTLGVTLGVAMAVHPGWAIYRLAHVHMLLLGFVTMMIYGVAYHVIPNFVGFRLHRPDAALRHWWGANIGLALMVCGFVVRVRTPYPGTVLLGAGGILYALGAYTFAYLVWRTLNGPESMRAAAQRAAIAVERGRTRGNRTLTVVEAKTRTGGR